MSRRIWSLVAVLSTLAIFSLAQAQDEGGRRGRGDRRDGPGRERREAPAEGRRDGFDPARMHERMINMLKQQSGAENAEWDAAGPKLREVMELRRQVRPGMGGMGQMGPRGGRRAAGGEAGAEEQPNKLDQAYRDLRAALQNPDTPAEEVSRKLTALREERSRVEQALEAAQKELKEAASPRIEAALVLNGILE